VPYFVEGLLDIEENRCGFLAKVFGRDNVIEDVNELKGSTVVMPKTELFGTN